MYIRQFAHIGVRPRPRDTPVKKQDAKKEYMHVQTVHLGSARSSHIEQNVDTFFTRIH